MFTKPSLSAVRALTFLGLNRRDQPWSPRSIAQQLGESPTYLAKVVRHLVRAGILKAHRGVTGGVVFNRLPQEITLLAIVEACQGAILGDFCSEAGELDKTCALHQAGADLHRSIVGVLSRWTLAQFLEKPRPDSSLADHVQCWLSPCPRLQALVISPREEPTAPGARASTKRKGPVGPRRRNA
jgi:Rrf2 family protein